MKILKETKSRIKVHDVKLRRIQIPRRSYKVWIEIAPVVWSSLLTLTEWDITLVLQSCDNERMETELMNCCHTFKISQR